MISVLAGLALYSSGANIQALSLVERSITLLGGRAKLESIRQITQTDASHNYLVEQSERPIGPYLVTYARGKRTYDFDNFSETAEQTLQGMVYGNREIPRKYTIEKGIGRASVPLENFISLRRLALGPERVLLVAASAPDLRLGKGTVFNGVPHDVLEFFWGPIPVRLFLKQGTGAPSGIETTSPLPFPWTPWGDVPMTTRWGAWQFVEGGLMTPGQFTTEVNGYPLLDETVIHSKATYGPGKISSHLPTLPKFEDPKTLMSRYRATKIVDGITEFTGPFNTFVVEQPDGLVVIEPVLTSSFAGEFLDRVVKDHPGKRVKAVIATDDAWPHFGGIRTFAARGSELVILDLNQTIVQRICASIHKSMPDELALHPAKPRLRLVRKPLTIGQGPNRMMIYPIGGQGSERMMIVYFPAHRLLYGSDLLQRQGNGFFFPSYPKELVEAVVREKLDVETVFGEHLSPTPWKVVTDFVTKMGGG